jgi:hypothetical protein
VSDTVHIGDPDGYYVSGFTWSSVPAVSLGTHQIWVDSAPWFSSYTITINGYTYPPGQVEYTFTSTPPTIRIDYVVDWTWSYLPPPFMAVEADEGGTTDPPPGVIIPSQAPHSITVTAVPDHGYLFDY